MPAIVHPVAIDPSSQAGVFLLNRELTVLPDEDANDSDKVFTVPADQVYHVRGIHIEYSTDATAGNRNVTVEFRDDANDIVHQLRAGAVQAADEGVPYLYDFAPGYPRDQAFVNNALLCPLPPDLYWPEGYDIHVADRNTISAAADDMIVQLLVDLYARETGGLGV